MISHDVSPHSGKVRVTFAIPASVWADTIHLVGDFNEWNERSHPLTLDEEHWKVTLELEEGREYRYRYLFNRAEWRADSNADKYLPNSYGGYDSVVIT